MSEMNLNKVSKNNEREIKYAKMDVKKMCENGRQKNFTKIESQKCTKIDGKKKLKNGQ